MAVQIVIKNSSAEDKRPTPAQLANGEIALNYNAAGAFLTCEDTDGNIQQVGGVKISEIAPDSPVKQTLWFQPSSLTLFVYDGNAFLPVAGGGGGGTPGGGITTIIGNNGIDASEIAGVVTLDVELAGGDDGLEFSASKLKASVASASQLGSVKIGDAINVASDGKITPQIASTSQTGIVKIGDAISVTGDGTITPRIASASQTGIVKIGSGIDVDGDGTISVDIPQTLNFKGPVDLNNAPTGQIQLPSAVGDAYVNSTNANPVNAGWAGIAGESSLAGDLVVWDGTEWEIIGTGGNGFDDRYLRIDAGTFSQTVASTGTTTFSGLTSHGGGVKVTGGSADTISFGIVSDNSTNIRIKANDSSIALFDNYAQVVSQPNGSGNVIFGINATIGGTNLTGTDNTCKVFDAQAQTSAVGKCNNVKGFNCGNPVGLLTNNAAGNSAYGFYGELFKTSLEDVALYNFYSAGNAPNFFKGDTYIGGTTTRNTRELWESTLTEEQKEQLTAGTFVVPANVSLPGDGEFARQWWYDQQDEETQALIDAGELDYPEPFAAATFTDTFALGDNTAINLLSNGAAYFKGAITGGGVNAANNNWIIRADGSTSGLTVTRAAVVTDEQAGTVETLLDIITDLRARVEALEAAATS